LKKLDLLVCVDSGLMHLRALMGRDLVAIFGPGDTTRWRPNLPEGCFEIVAKEIACRPCLSNNCSNPHCLNLIEIEDVIFAIEKQLNKRHIKKTKG